MYPLYLQRVVEPVKPGSRPVLVDRLWPRGVRKDQATWELWLRDVAPSQELRRWYGHDPERRAEFRRRYREELHDPSHAAPLLQLRALHREQVLTLLTSTRSVEESHLPVLADVLRGG